MLCGMFELGTILDNKLILTGYNHIFLSGILQIAKKKKKQQIPLLLSTHKSTHLEIFTNLTFIKCNYFLQKSFPPPLN